MDLSAAVNFVASTRQSMLTTIRKNGRPQLSNVLHQVFDDGLIRVSITSERAKYRNIRRDPWVALHVTQSDFWAWAVLEGEAELTPVASDPDDPTVDELVEYYRAAAGEHDDWAEYRRVMVADHRVILRIRPHRAYGTLPSSAGTP